MQPELVTVDKNDQSGEERLRLNYNGVIGLLVEAVKNCAMKSVKSRRADNGDWIRMGRVICSK